MKIVDRRADEGKRQTSRGASCGGGADIRAGEVGGMGGLKGWWGAVEWRCLGLGLGDVGMWVWGMGVWGMGVWVWGMGYGGMGYVGIWELNQASWSGG